MKDLAERVPEDDWFCSRCKSIIISHQHLENSLKPTNRSAYDETHPEVIKKQKLNIENTSCHMCYSLIGVMIQVSLRDISKHTDKVSDISTGHRGGRSSSRGGSRR